MHVSFDMPTIWPHGTVMTGTVYREEGCESGARLAHLVQVAPDLTNSPFSVVRGRALSWRA